MVEIQFVPSLNFRRRGHLRRYKSGMRLSLNGRHKNCGWTGMGVLVPQVTRGVSKYGNLARFVILFAHLSLKYPFISKHLCR